MRPFTFRYNNKDFDAKFLVESVAIGEIIYVQITDQELIEFAGAHLLFYREIGIEPEFRYQRARNNEISSRLLRHSIIDALKDC